MTRREMLWLLASAARAQQTGGMATRGVAPQPRGKPSGLPFHARFTDVAATAGLREPVIYGPVGRTDYILESMGCGVAFLDYDNDGWLDILRAFAAPGARARCPAPPTGFTITIATAPSPTSPAGRADAPGLGLRRDHRRLQQRRL